MVTNPPRPVSAVQTFWQNHLAVFPPSLDFPIAPTAEMDRQPGPVRDRVPIPLTAETIARLHAHSVAPASVLLLSTLMVLLHRYTHQPEIAVMALMEPVQADHPVIVQTQMQGQTGEQLARDVQAIYHCGQHHAIALSQLRAIAQEYGETVVQNLTQIVFVHRSGSPSVEWRENATQLIQSANDLAFIWEEIDGTVQGYLDYNSHHLSRDFARQLVSYFGTILTHLLTDLNQPISTLPILTEDQFRQMVFTWNQTDTDYPRDVCVHQLFEAQVERTPHAIAIEFEGRTLTFAELNARANQMAHYLRSRGVGQETLVGLCLERSEQVLVGILGILKAGGAYIPLDPGYPRDRLALMLEDSQAPVLVTQESLRTFLPHQSATIVCLDTDWDAIAPHPTTNPNCITNPENLIYIIYTSGSTGKPKGVMIQHQSFVNLMTSMRQTPGLKKSDIFLSPTSISFDMVGPEIYLPLVTGAKIFMVSRAVATDGIQLVKALTESNATAMQATPASWRLLIEAGWAGHPNLKILCGGEAMPRDLVAPLLDRCGELWNMYGPTETTVWSTCYRVTEERSSIPVGYPFTNTQLYVLDAQMQPVPIGVIGELYIGGDGVARGYLNREELNTEKFITDPFRSHSRMYKTGDLARWLPDGSLDFLGRIDHQVKIRGYRIELGEIESVLSKHPAVRVAIVIAREDEPGDKRLVAYVVVDPPVGTGELRRLLKDQLPDYMVPAAIVRLDQLPLSPNGKVDRKALPAPSTIEQEPADGYVPPRTPLETQLVQLWEEVLGLKPISITDSFLELGGQSLLAVRLAKRIEQTCGRMIPPAILFQTGTVEQLAIALSDENWTSTAPSAVCLKPGKPGRSPIFFLHVLGQGFKYVRPLISHLTSDHPIYGLSIQLMAEESLPKNEVPDLAEFYVQELRSLQPQGPYYLAGISFGGKVAYEVAQRLTRQGETVKLLALFDTDGPDLTRPLSLAEKSQQICQEFLATGPTYLLKKLQGRWNLIMADLSDRAIQFSGTLYQQCLDLLGRPHPESLRFWMIESDNERASRSYHPQVYPGSVVLFRAMAQTYSQAYLETELGWKDLAQGGIATHAIPGGHLTMLQEPYVALLAEQVQRYLP